MSADSSPFRVPAMRAEGEFASEFEDRPIRVSAFFSLLFGLLSSFALLGRPLLILPAVAIVLGLFALRKSDRGQPIGKPAALIGLILAFGFGAAGFCVPWFTDRHLGPQAEYFAKQYFKLVANEEIPLALELRKPSNRRFPPTMSLDAAYMRDSELAELVVRFREEEPVELIRDAGVDAEWVISKRRTFREFGEDRVEFVCWPKGFPDHEALLVRMHYRISPRTGHGEWYVGYCEMDREPLFAPSVV